MKNLYCDECSNKLEVNYDPILEQVFVKPCMICVNKYITESRWGAEINASVKASLTALNEIYKILNKGDKK